MRLSTTDHIITLTRSPIILAPILHAFYSHLPATRNNILLSYLVLPFIIHQNTSDYLFKLSGRSTLRTMCSKQERLAGVDKRIETLKPVTNAAIIGLVKSGHLVIDGDLSVVPTRKTMLCPEGLERQLVAAQKLAGLFEHAEAPSIYQLLGITQL